MEFLKRDECKAAVSTRAQRVAPEGLFDIEKIRLIADITCGDIQHSCSTEFDARPGLLSTEEKFIGAEMDLGIELTELLDDICSECPNNPNHTQLVS